MYQHPIAHRANIFCLTLITTDCSCMQSTKQHLARPERQPASSALHKSATTESEACSTLLPESPGSSALMSAGQSGSPQSLAWTQRTLAHSGLPCNLIRLVSI
jgi:hypothetical protein